MATAVGVNGSVTFVTGHNAKFDRYALTIGQRMINTTGYDSGGFEENTAGLKYGFGKASGHMKYGVASSAPGIDVLSQTGATSTFQIAVGCTLAATTVIETISINSDVNGEERVDFNFRLSGTITQIWAEA